MAATGGTQRNVARAASASASAPLSSAPRRRCRQNDRTAVVAAAAGPDGSGSGGSGSGTGGSGSGNVPAPLSTFLNFESVLQNALALRGPPGARNGDWKQVAGCWVLFPPPGVRPEVVCHFIGGAFVGAAPQLAYKAFLEALAARGAVVVATPFSTGFDQMRIADQVHYAFGQAVAALGDDVARLPVFGVGHSLGSLLHSIVCSRYTPDRAGNALMSFNNRPATDTIPLLSGVLAPSARALGPLLQQLATPGPLRAAGETALSALRGLSPALVQQVLPVLDQLRPIFDDVAQGREEFTPPPDETKRLIRSNYSVRRNLLLRFSDDTIDETLALGMLLQSGSAISSSLDISVRTLPGDHIRPMQQALVDLPPDLARAAAQGAAQGGTLLGRLAGLAQQAGVQSAAAPLNDLSKGASALADLFAGSASGGGASGGGGGSGGAGAAGGGPVADSIQALADEVAAFMGVGGVVTQGSRALPAAVVVERTRTGDA